MSFLCQIYCYLYYDKDPELFYAIENSTIGALTKF